MVSGFAVPKIPLPPVYPPPWHKRPSLDKCYALRQLVTQVFTDNPIEKPTKKYSSIADRHAILGHIDAGNWGTAKMRLELGQAGIPQEEVEKIISSMTLLE